MFGRRATENLEIDSLNGCESGPAARSLISVRVLHPHCGNSKYHHLMHATNKSTWHSLSYACRKHHDITSTFLCMPQTRWRNAEHLMHAANKSTWHPLSYACHKQDDVTSTILCMPQTRWRAVHHLMHMHAAHKMTWRPPSYACRKQDDVTSTILSCRKQVDVTFTIICMP